LATYDRVSSDTRSGLAMARLTVAVDTPARRATSRIVTPPPMERRRGLDARDMGTCLLDNAFVRPLTSFEVWLLSM
jgi:hypothetical protein